MVVLALRLRLPGPQWQGPGVVAVPPMRPAHFPRPPQAVVGVAGQLQLPSPAQAGLLTPEEVVEAVAQVARVVLASL